MKALLMRICLSFLLLVSFTTFSKTYYVSENGDDNNDGLTVKTAWATTANVNKLSLQPGDSVLFAAGDVFNSGLVLEQAHGTVSEPIVISTYDASGENTEPRRAKIDAGKRLNALSIIDSSFVRISNLELSAITPIMSEKTTSHKRKRPAMRIGVLVKAKKPGTYESIELDNLFVRDVFYYSKNVTRNSEEVKTANGTQSYGWGIRVINNLSDALIRDVVIKNTRVENVAHTGVKFTSKHRRILDVQVTGNSIKRTGGPGIQLSGVIGGHFSSNNVDRSGSPDDPRKWGRGSGLWTWSSEKIVIEHNSFTNANGPGDSAGVHIDYNCRDIVVQYNFSANNAGGFYEVLGNNFNTVYRYNISYNDGHRVKGKNGAFQEGKSFWLSGYNGKNKRKGPYFSYFYNNTIVVDAFMSSKVAIDRATEGALVANNIFHIVGNAEYVLGDQYKPDKSGKLKIKNFIFENNLFLHERSWPKDAPVADKMGLIGDAGFHISQQPLVTDFVPSNVELVKNKGRLIEKLPGDNKGIFTGLNLSRDIFGNPIIGTPDLGAVELP